MLGRYNYSNGPLVSNRVDPRIRCLIFYVSVKVGQKRRCQRHEVPVQVGASYKCGCLKCVACHHKT